MSIFFTYLYTVLHSRLCRRGSNIQIKVFGSLVEYSPHDPVMVGGPGSGPGRAGHVFLGVLIKGWKDLHSTVLLIPFVVRSVLSRPRSAPQRRATISGSTHTQFRPYINVSEVSRDLRPMKSRDPFPCRIPPSLCITIVFTIFNFFRLVLCV
jgi:hypothetical protein